MVLRVKIQLKEISKPPVWRRVLVPAQFSFHNFHRVIQAAFGWQDCHLYQFSPSGYGSSPQIGIKDEDWSEDSIQDSHKTKLQQYLYEKGQKFSYIYDFGDDWIHQITVEEVLEEVRISPQLISGKGTCPPEDCGGVWGYEELKLVLNNPKHPENREMRKWLGMLSTERWDPNFLELEELQFAVLVIQ
jgi:hypothetical protein